MSDSQMLKLENLKGVVDEVQPRREIEKAGTFFRLLMEKAEEVRNRVKESKGITPSPILSLIHDILRDELIDELYEFGVVDSKGKDLPFHTVLVTLVSLKLGKGMGYETKRLLKLGLAAFLENVGMYRISDTILQKPGELSPNEMAQIRKHPEISGRILNELGESLQWLAEVAVQVHERTDGSGYPMGLKGEAISEFASIIGLTDIYMAMIQNRPYRNGHIQSEAVKHIIGPLKPLFPLKVVKAFLEQISLFPVNSCVRLNNNSIGRVLSTDKNQPLRPTIELLYDGLGQKMEKRKKISLSDAPLLHIVGCMGEKELP